MDLDSAALSCSSIRMKFGRLFSSLPNEISFRKDGNQMFFLRNASFVGNCLFSRDIDDPLGAVKKVLNPDGIQKLSLSEKLLRERMRASGSGITYYKYIKPIDSLLVNTGPGCCLVLCGQEQEENLLSFPCKEGAIDYKLCPEDSKVLGCVSDGDIYLLPSYCTKPLQLTDTFGKRPLRKITAGQSSFILQEEFDRYTGYWWAPDSGKDGVFRILYEEVDETAVEIVKTFNPSTQELDTYSYPRAGSVNAVSTLKLVSFKISNEQIVERVTYELPKQVNDYLKEWEYSVRIGWTDDGNNIWILLMNREQNRSQIILINSKTFEGTPDCPLPVILWEENSKVWINYFNIEYIEFLPPTDTLSTRLLITSEMFGYPHIVLLEGNLLPLQFSTDEFNPVKADLRHRFVTQGEWNVLTSQVWFDNDKNLVYFSGNRSSCLDSHLYVVDLNGELPCNNPKQLTPNGFYHSISLDTAAKLFATNCSNQSTPPSVSVYSIDTTSLEAKCLFELHEAPIMPDNFSPPTNFTTNSATGEALHGIVYPPTNVEEGKRYRTVLYVYGGPAIQLVKNSFSPSIIKLSEWIHNGFAVVVLDNRGTANRGTQFESYIQGIMGSVEIDDQVAGLEAAAKAVPYIDLKRVAISGWSYGGYMSLLALAKKPEHFKVAIAGAPVTDWLWYDTGYTERYLGVPPTAKLAYENSSVVPLAKDFPSTPGRLLIIHGMSDENVFFTHTSLLIDSLVKHKKPYQLQMYNGERHGLRSPVASTHCDATILAFLQENL